MVKKLWKKVNEIQPELVVLDVMLPKKDGIEVCKTIRSDKNLVPILMLTAKMMSLIV